MVDPNHSDDHLLDRVFENAKGAQIPDQIEKRLNTVFENFSKELRAEASRSREQNRGWMYCSVALAAAASLLLILSINNWYSQPSGHSLSDQTDTQEHVTQQTEEALDRSKKGIQQLLLVSRYSQRPSLPLDLVNGSLDDADEVPAGWKFLSTSPNHRLEVVADNENQKHVRIVGTGSRPSEDFGNLMQSLDATTFRNQRILLSGKVRTTGLANAASAHLWVRVDGIQDDERIVPLVFDNMLQRPITSNEWGTYSIVCDIPTNAVNLNVGFFLLNAGSGEVDDLVLKVVDKTVPVTAKALAKKDPVETDASESAKTPSKPTQLDANAAKSEDSSQPSQIPAQKDKAIIKNAGFEQSTPLSPAQSWILNPSATRVELESENCAEGKTCLRFRSDPSRFAGFGASLSQWIQADQLGGRVIEVKAAARVESSTGGRIHLLLEANRPSGNGGMARVIVDHMDQRPITESTWSYYKIVVRLPKNASNIRIGADFVGSGVAWLDDFQLSVLDENDSFTLTAESREIPLPSQESSGWIAFGLSLAAISVGLFLWANRRNESFAQPFALRFATVYWLLYCDSTITQIVARIPVINLLTNVHSVGIDWLVRRTARDVLGIQRDLIPPNGSGDTTYSYIQLLVFAGIAILVAAIWRLVYQSPRSDRLIYEIYVSFLRYSLALVLVGYGVAKVVVQGNQFASPGPESLQIAVGDLTPMSLIWLMMGSSKAYTFIAGAGEIVAGLLLLWRRTTLLGAGIGLGVMLNVAFLNLCYEIPVKQYSLHLVCMCLLILATDLRWLQVILGSRSVEGRELGPTLPNRYWKWGYYLAKIIILYLAFWPYGQRLVSDWRTPAPPKHPLVGVYEVDSIPNKQELEKPSQPQAWDRFMIRQRRAFGTAPTYDIVIRDTKDKTSVQQAHLPDDKSIVIGRSRLTCSWLDEHRVQITGELEGVQVDFIATRKGTILTSRGFHWINEVPYN